MQKKPRDFNWKHLNANREDRVHNEIDGKVKPLLKRGERRGLVALLALLLLILSAFVALSGMGRAYAQSNCFILCAAASSTLTPDASPTLTTTPVSSPTVTPTPKPSPTARPTQKPTPVPTATVAISPTASASLSPTATATSSEVGATPDGTTTATAVSAASLTRGNSGNPPASTGFSGLALVAGSVVMALLLLFLGGGLAWRSVRRALVPLAKVKLPPSGAQPWSRYRAPNPGDFPPMPAPALADAETTFLPFAANEHLSALADTDTDQIPPVV